MVPVAGEPLRTLGRRGSWQSPPLTLSWAIQSRFCTRWTSIHSRQFFHPPRYLVDSLQQSFVLGHVAQSHQLSLGRLTAASTVLRLRAFCGDHAFCTRIGEASSGVTSPDVFPRPNVSIWSAHALNVTVHDRLQLVIVVWNFLYYAYDRFCKPVLFLTFLQLSSCPVEIETNLHTYVKLRPHLDRHE